MKVIYNKYSASGSFVGERVYEAMDRADLERVLAIIENNPDDFELVNVEGVC